MEAALGKQLRTGGSVVGRQREAEQAFASLLEAPPKPIAAALCRCEQLDVGLTHPEQGVDRAEPRMLAAPGGAAAEQPGGA